jgi:hypothetical protein
MPSLLSTVDPSGPAIYYSEKFRQMVEDHLLILRALPGNTTYQIANDDMAKLNRYTGDFYGFLTALNLDRRYHWTILRMNGFRSRFDLDLTLTHLLLPDYAYLDKLSQLCKEKR